MSQVCDERAQRGSMPWRRLHTAGRWLARKPIALLYVVLAVVMLAGLARFYDPRTGLTPLIVFGDRFASVRVSRLSNVAVYTYPSSDGYDGQFYAQVAVVGNPFDPELRTALDSPAYREGRILLPIVAHVAGLGRPAWVLTAYALSNVVCWLLLALAIARWWFPPTSVDSLLRWVGIMFGAGLLASVTRSLTDGPALLLVAAGARHVETHRRGLAAGLLGAACLVREMSVLAATALLPDRLTPRSAWPRALAAAAACAVPVTLWQAIVSARFGAVSHGGLGALGVPLAAFVHSCKLLVDVVRASGWLAARDRAVVVVAVAVQVAFVFLRPQPARAWWRIGVASAVLALFLGPQPWVDPLNGVTRMLLPLHLAFNVLVPRTRAGMALLLAGNATVLSASRPFEGAPAAEQTTFAEGITAAYAAGWYEKEQLGLRTWRWASGDATLSLNNPLTGSRRVVVAFDLSSRTARTVTIDGPAVHDVIRLAADRRAHVELGPFELPPGQSSLSLHTTQAPWIEPGPEERRRALAFSLRNLSLTTSPSL